MSSWTLLWVIAACCCMQGNTVPFHARSESEVGDYNDYSEDNTNNSDESDSNESLFETIHDTFNKIKSKTLIPKRNIRIPGTLDSDADSSSWLDDDSAEDIGPSIEIIGSDENININYGSGNGNFRSKSYSNHAESEELVRRSNRIEIPQDNQNEKQSLFENYTKTALNEDLGVMTGKKIVKKTKSVHIGEDVTLCWIETLTVKEDNSSVPTKRQVSRDYTISFENSAPIPEEYLDCSRSDGKSSADQECAVVKTTSNKLINNDTKMSKVLNFTKESREGNFFITEYKNIRCAVGSVVTKDVYEWLDNPKKPKRRVEIKVGSLNNRLGVQDDSIELSLTKHFTKIPSGVPSIENDCEEGKKCSEKSVPLMKCIGKNCGVDKTLKGISTLEIQNEDDRRSNTNTKKIPEDDLKKLKGNKPSLMNGKYSKGQIPEDDSSSPSSNKKRVTGGDAMISQQKNITWKISKSLPWDNTSSNYTFDNGSVSLCGDSEDCSDSSGTVEFGEKHIIESFFNQSSNCNGSSGECQSSSEPSDETSESSSYEKSSENDELKTKPVICTETDSKKCNDSLIIRDDSAHTKTKHSTVSEKQSSELSSTNLDKIPSKVSTDNISDEGNIPEDKKKSSTGIRQPTTSINLLNDTSNSSIDSSKSLTKENGKSSINIQNVTLRPESAFDSSNGDVEDQTNPSTYSEDIQDTISLAADDLLKHITADVKDEQENSTPHSRERALDCSDPKDCAKLTSLLPSESTEPEDDSSTDSSSGDTQLIDSENSNDDSDAECEGNGDCSATTDSIEGISKFSLPQSSNETRLSSTLATPVEIDGSIIPMIRNISTIVETKSSLPIKASPSIKNEKQGKHRLALKIKVLLEQINDDKEKLPLVQVEKLVTLNEDEDQNGNQSLLWKIKALNNSGESIQSIKDFLDCSALENFTDLSHEMIQNLKIELNQQELNSENETQNHLPRKRASESIGEIKENISLKSEDVKRCLPSIHGGIKTGLYKILSEISSSLNISKNSTIENNKDVSLNIDNNEEKQTKDLEQKLTDISGNEGNVSMIPDADQLVRKWSKERISRLLDGGELRSSIELTILHEHDGSHHDT